MSSVSHLNPVFWEEPSLLNMSGPVLVRDQSNNFSFTKVDVKTDKALNCLPNSFKLSNLSEIQDLHL